MAVEIGNFDEKNNAVSAKNNHLKLNQINFKQVIRLNYKQLLKTRLTLDNINKITNNETLFCLMPWCFVFACL